MIALKVSWSQVMKVSCSKNSLWCFMRWTLQWVSTSFHIFSHPKTRSESCTSENKMVLNKNGEWFRIKMHRDNTFEFQHCKSLFLITIPYIYISSHLSSSSSGLYYKGKSKKPLIVIENHWNHRTIRASLLRNSILLFKFYLNLKRRLEMREFSAIFNSSPFPSLKDLDP